MYKSALAELDKSPSTLFTSCEMAARKHLLETISYDNLGDYAQADANMQRVERPPCKDASPILAADIATERGALTENLMAAESEYRTALLIARSQHDTFREARALLDLSNATQLQERYDESIAWGQASIKVSMPMGYKALQEIVEGNLAWNYYKLGDFDQALRLSSEAEDMAGKIGAGSQQLRWRNNLGLLHEQLGQFALAESDYRQALATAQRLGDENQITIALDELAIVSVRAGHWETAANFTRQALELAKKDQNRELELQALLAQGMIADHQGDGKTAGSRFAEVARDNSDAPRSLHWEAQATLADFYAKQQNAVQAEAEYQTALGTVRQARCSIQHEDLRLPFFANVTHVYDNYIDFLVQQGKTLEALKIADESRALTLAEGLGVEGKNCLASEAVFNPQKSARGAGATILFYWLGAEHSYLWVVDPQRVKLFPLPSSAAIDPMIKDYRAALIGARDPLAAGDKNGQQLYQTLVAPAASLIPANGRVIVITDGSLSGLGFDSLIVPEPKPHYWIEDVMLENASSLRLLAAHSTQRNTSEGRAAEGKLLLMGNAAASGDPAFPPLRHASEEMRGVGGHFPSANQQGYNGNGATVENYMRSHPEGFTYIHFVAHGTASITDPLDSAVVLSPASQGGNYKLYARDVIAHPLKAQLVTISACKGAGTGLVGEGLVGLSWAFLHAGAHNVVGALWDVSDESTPQLMDAMYAELAKGNSPDAALRAAKLSLLHSAGVFHKPVYWAVFQLYTGS